MLFLTRAVAYYLVASIGFGYTFAQSGSEYPPLPLPANVTSAYVDTTNTSGLVFHYLSAGCDPSNTKPLVLIVHGFPELAFGFKDMLLPIAKQGYCVVAPDQRGYGRTTGWDNRPWADTDVSEWEFERLVRDLISLVWAIGYKKVHTVIGHDFGIMPAGWATLMRPDIFQALFLMSVPYGLPTQPSFKLQSYTTPPSFANLSVSQWSTSDLENQLELLQPPRKNYQWVNSESNAAKDYDSSTALGGLHQFFRVMWYIKSADHLKVFPPPHKLAGPDASALAVVPYFYIPLANQTITEALAALYKGYNASASKSWFPDSDIDVYVSEFQRNGFQGALNYYRYLESAPSTSSALEFVWAGRKVQVPTFFLAGKYDWQIYFEYGAYENLPNISEDYRGSVLLNASGHWPYIEQANETVYYINKFLASL